MNNAHRIENKFIFVYNPAPHMTMLGKVCVQLGFNEKRPVMLGVCFSIWQQ